MIYNNDPNNKNKLFLAHHIKSKCSFSNNKKLSQETTKIQYKWIKKCFKSTFKRFHRRGRSSRLKRDRSKMQAHVIEKCDLHKHWSM